MILIDFSPVVIATYIGKQTSDDRKKQSVEEAVFDYLRFTKTKFQNEYGEMIICCDSKNNWRKDRFPFYKAGRKAIRQKSKFDWDIIHTKISEIKTALDENFPYRVIEVDKAEADDVIAVLVREFPNQKNVIVSTDRDFMQLQILKNTTQFCPRKKTFMTIDNPELFLREKIIFGDTGDGVPNIKSPDNVFVRDDIRQTPIRRTKVAEWIHMNEEEFCDSEMFKNYRRNAMLVDYAYIPTEMSNKIVHEFQNAKQSNKQHLMNYFMEKNYGSLMESLGDF